MGDDALAALGPADKGSSAGEWQAQHSLQWRQQQEQQTGSLHLPIDIADVTWEVEEERFFHVEADNESATDNPKFSNLDSHDSSEDEAGEVGGGPLVVGGSNAKSHDSRSDEEDGLFNNVLVDALSSEHHPDGSSNREGSDSVGSDLEKGSSGSDSSSSWSGEVPSSLDDAGIDSMSQSSALKSLDSTSQSSFGSGDIQVRCAGGTANPAAGTAAYMGETGVRLDDSDSVQQSHSIGESYMSSDI